MNATPRGDRNGANPFVGPKPFGQTDPLYGRDREVRELRDLLISQRIVVFYSPSGAGKTSLIDANAAAPLPAEPDGDMDHPAHAGLRWEMERAHFRVLPVIRVNRAPTRKPRAVGNRYVLSALLSLEENHPRGKPRRVADLAGMTLAQYLAEWPPAEDSPTNDVLIFDQFEELLTLDPTDRDAKEAFLTQVRDVLWDGDRWALFSLREDHLGGLDPYAAEIPTQLAAAYRLDLLDRDAAKLAMQNPAARTGVEFPEAAAQKLLDDLGRVRVSHPDGSSDERPGLYVEPVHLQVVCQRLWEEAVARDRRIDPALVAEVGAVDDALRHFYAAAVAAVAAECDVPERTIRSWFDERLITGNGVRGQVMQEEAEAAGLSSHAIDTLVDRHLVRREPRRGVPWLELAHDRLIGPVRADNNEWYRHNLNSVQQAAKAWDNGARQPGFLLTGDALALAEAWEAEPEANLTELEQAFLGASRQQRDKQKLEETEKARDEAEQRAAEQAQSAHRIKRWAMAVALLALVALIAAVYANNQRQAADAQRQSSRSQLLAKQAEDEPNRAAKWLLMAEALHADDTVDARVTMLETMQRFLPSPQIWQDPLQSVANGASEVRGLAFLDDSALVVVDAGGTLRLWPITDNVRNEPQAIVAGNPRSLALANDGVFLATGGSAGVQLWNARTLEPLQEVSTEDVTSVAFAPDGKDLVFGSADGKVRLYNLDTAKTTILQSPRTGAENRVNAVAYSNTGIIAAGRDGGTISLWRNRPDSTLPPALRPSLVIRDEQNNIVDAPSIASLAFNPAGDVLAAGDNSGTITRWLIANRTRFLEPLRQGDEALVSLAYSPDGVVIAAADRAGRVGLWEAATDRLIEALPLDRASGVWSVVISPNGALLATGDGVGAINLWSRVGLPHAVEAPVNLGLDNVAAVAFSPGAHTLVASGLKDAKPTVRLCVATTSPITCRTLGEGRYAIQGLAISHRGDQLAWGDSSGEITVAPLAENEELISLTADSGVEALAFSSDGSMLFAGTAGGAPAQGGDEPGLPSVQMWNLDSPGKAPNAAGTPATLPQDRPARVTALASSPKEPVLAAFDEGTVTWSIADGALVDQRRLHVPPQSTPLAGRPLSSVRSLTFDENGTLLAAAGGNVVVWNADTGHALLHDAPLLLDAQSIAFAPGGTQLVSGHTRGHIRLWDIEPTGDFAGDLLRLTAEVVGLAWIDAHTIIAVDADGIVLKLDADPAHWEKIACQTAGRNFNQEELDRYFPDAAPAACPDQPGEATASPAITS